MMRIAYKRLMLVLVPIHIPDAKMKMILFKIVLLFSMSLLSFFPLGVCSHSTNEVENK